MDLDTSIDQEMPLSFMSSEVLEEQLQIGKKKDKYQDEDTRSDSGSSIFSAGSDSSSGSLTVKIEDRNFLYRFSLSIGLLL